MTQLSRNAAASSETANKEAVMQARMEPFIAVVVVGPTSIHCDGINTATVMGCSPAELRSTHDISPVLQCLAAVCGAHWPEVEVVIEGPRDLCELLIQELGARGIPATDSTTLDEVAGPTHPPKSPAQYPVAAAAGEPETSAQALALPQQAVAEVPQQPTPHIEPTAADLDGIFESLPAAAPPELGAQLRERSIAQSKASGGWSRMLRWFGLALCAIILGSTIGWLGTYVRGHLHDPPLLETEPAAPPSRSGAALPIATPSVSAPPRPSSTTPAPAVEVVEGGVKIMLPPGMQAAPRAGGGQVITGPDAALRVYLLAEPVPATGGAAYLSGLSAAIATDPELSELPLPRSLFAGIKSEAVAYTEDPGDGSAVQWGVWLKGDEIVSLGCHSRGPLNHAQRASCKQVITAVQGG